MANFTESQITDMMKFINEYGGVDPDNITRELAILELEDMERKGCVHESANRFDQCRDCPNSEKCPVLDWEKRHPEYANDELAMKIKVLEAGGIEAYKEKTKMQDELLKKAARSKAMDIAKQKLLRDLDVKRFAETDEDIEKWINECEAHFEAYVQARIALNKDKLC